MDESVLTSRETDAFLACFAGRERLVFGSDEGPPARAQGVEFRVTVHVSDRWARFRIDASPLGVLAQ